ncbi:MAG: hypothetical protein A3D31_09530 [Candidatus Fluviicola riflensis]|nr:MAG: hypothetical protein A3D31_09530 [Candidatus Fluviicola riflensis]OGS82182.1 MAG: hypothetical protein A2724_18475 [Fluviicola sp. RIFCSPHIGHO2_01_FULL_43_53]OGS87875.1 MAG: hypothetical protein A3E30_15910 [Fluviicola sp. RIFCSPHIGHO2_12_FULL_43_24]
MKRKYNCLIKNHFSFQEYRIEPIRDEDMYSIMAFRNEQLFHLRQSEPLTKEQQEHYFGTVIKALFEAEKPDQLLFSFFHNDVFVGYGGVVHINWLDRHAEISFVMDTSLESTRFESYWQAFLTLIEQVAFEELRFHKLFTYAYNLRPNLYVTIEKANYKQEAILKEHCLFNGEYIDVYIHSKTNTPIFESILRPVNENDTKALFNWVNDPEVRFNSIQQEPILWEDHLQWFRRKLQDDATHMFLLEYAGKAVGQIRIDQSEEYHYIGYSIDNNYRGKGFGKCIVAQLLKMHPTLSFAAVVKKTNIPSIRIFESLGFELKENLSNHHDIYTFVKE